MIGRMGSVSFEGFRSRALRFGCKGRGRRENVGKPRVDDVAF